MRFLIGCCLGIFGVLTSTQLLAQPVLLKGMVKDHLSNNPIVNVHIRITHTEEGTFTDRDGQFSLILKKVPVSITLSCVGYQSLYYEIGEIPFKPLELFLQPITLTLREVDIKATRYQYLFKDHAYSVLDYEILDDQLLLLVFRYQLKHAVLILLNMDGDTLVMMPVPESKPRCLHKDYRGNVHYISTRGNAFRCQWNKARNQLEYPAHTTYDSLVRRSQPFLFSAGERDYFQELSPDGLGINFGYIDKNRQKRYVQTIQDHVTRKQYADEVKFLNLWNRMVQTDQTIRPESPPPTHYRRINAPMVKLGEDTLAVFHFCENEIKFLHHDGRVFRTVPITFHKDNNVNLLAGLLQVFVPVSEWEWNGKILIDPYFREAYATFSKNGMVQLRKIDLQTGTLTHRVDIPFPFPQKIEIYRGNAFFLYKEISAEFEKWKLVKLKL